MACLNSSDHSKLEFGPFSVLVNLLDELPWRQVAQTRVGTDTPFNPRLRSPARNAVLLLSKNNVVLWIRSMLVLNKNHVRFLDKTNADKSDVLFLNKSYVLLLKKNTVNKSYVLVPNRNNVSF